MRLVGVLVSASLLGVCHNAQARVAWAPPRSPAQLLSQASDDALAPLNGEPLSPLSWLSYSVAASARFRLSGAQDYDLLARYLNPAQARTPEWRGFWLGRYGHRTWTWSAPLLWSAEAADTEPAPPPASSTDWGLDLKWEPLRLALQPQFATHRLAPLVEAPEPLHSGVEVQPSCADGRVPRPVTLGRFGAETDRFALLECDGSIAPEALDRLSVMARPPGAPRPELPLPDVPTADELYPGEWLPQVKMLHPRLVWALERIASAFPGRPIYIVSGYRRGSHASYHTQGRALDLSVWHTSNEEVLAVCRKLKDVGCGYYPYNKFIHLDVRGANTGHTLWIDASQPGESSRYVSSWPGVVEGGATSWAVGE